MAEARPISLAPRALLADGAELPLLSGALHYFRVPRRHWGACLDAVRALGLGIVETYVPWGVHETAPGRYRFTADLDLGAFLDAAAERGLKVLVRPGPHINAELTWFGFPERIVADPAMQARSARGTPVVLPAPPRFFPVPSYASRRFLAAVREWYAAVAEVVGPRRFPAGPVVGIQVDNEQGHFFRAGAFSGDYHDDAVAAYEAETGQLPPRSLGGSSPEALAPVLRWIGWKERQITVALASLAGMLDEVGLGGLARYHNFPPVEPGVYDVADAETALDFAGIDLYHLARDYERIRRRSLYLAGSSRLPYVPELGVGAFPWGPPFGDRDTRALVLGALMHGVAGVNYYMLVERDRWYGSPVSASGELRPGLSDDLKKLHAALQQAGWTGLARHADVAVLMPRGYGRLALAASHLGPVGPAVGEWLGLDERHMASDATYGLAGPVQQEQAAWREAILTALESAHVPFVLADASVPAAMLQRSKLVIVPTFDFIERDLADKLRAYAAAGGKLASGPRVPSRDEAMQPWDGSLPGARLDAALLDDPRKLSSELLSLAAAAGARRPAPAKEPTVDTALHVRADGTPALLFAGTRAAEPGRATVELETRAEVEDVLTGERFAGETLSIPLAPFGVRMLRFA